MGNDFLLLMIAYGVILGALALGIYTLAEKRAFFTSPAEGTVQFVVRGKKAKSAILAWSGYRFLGGSDPHEKYKIVKANLFESLFHYLNPLHWMEWAGIYWTGVYPFLKVYTYDFDWVEEKTDADGKVIPWARHATKRAGTEGQTWFIYVNDVNYFFIVDDVKTKSGVQLKLVLLVTVRVENPYKALFLGENWNERTGGAVRNMAVKYAGSLEYEQITASAPSLIPVFKNGAMVASESHTLEELILMLGDGQPDDLHGSDLLNDYGVRIVAAKVHSIDFADEEARTQLSASTTRVYTATQEGLAAEAEAKGKAKATIITAEAQAEAVAIAAAAESKRIDVVYGAVAGKDPLARQEIRRLEAYEKTGAAGGTTTVVPAEVMGLAAAGKIALPTSHKKE